MASKPSLRFRIARTLLGSKAKEFIPPLGLWDGIGFDAQGRLKQYTTKPEQLAANMSWVYAANTSIADPCAAVPLKLWRRKKDGDREEITNGDELELLTLLYEPNLAHAGEQMRQLHYTYMNLVGESYLLMLKNGQPFIPQAGKPLDTEAFSRRLKMQTEVAQGLGLPSASNVRGLSCASSSLGFSTRCRRPTAAAGS
jgi:hypothetical protein